MTTNSFDFDAPIVGLELSVRATNALTKAGILTVSALSTMTERELLRLPNFGRMCLAEVRAVLEMVRANAPPIDKSKHPRCWTCRHWHVENHGDAMGSCGVTYALSHSNVPSPYDGKTKAFAAAEEGECRLMTAPDFGCIQHEPR